MSQIQNGILAALAVTTTFGVAQLASGHDLIGRRQLASTALETGTAPEAGVNRAAKADRAAATVAPGQAQTIALRFDNLADTSVLVRFPVVKGEARNPPVAPAKPATTK